jgi:hypothetical protein
LPITEDADNNDPTDNCACCPTIAGRDCNWQWCSHYRWIQSHFQSIKHALKENGIGPFMVEERCQAAWAIDTILGGPTLWELGCPGYPCDMTLQAAAAGFGQIPEEDVTPAVSLAFNCEDFAELLRGRTLIAQIQVYTDTGTGAVQTILSDAKVIRGPSPNLGEPFLFAGIENQAPVRVQLLAGAGIVREFGFLDPRLIGSEEPGEPGLRPEALWTLYLPWSHPPTPPVDRIRVIGFGQTWLDSALQLSVEESPLELVCQEISAIPAVSTWGLAVMGLLTAVAGTLLLRRRIVTGRVSLGSNKRIP